MKPLPLLALRPHPPVCSLRNVGLGITHVRLVLKSSALRGSAASTVSVCVNCHISAHGLEMVHVDWTGRATRLCATLRPTPADTKNLSFLITHNSHHVQKTFLQCN